MNQPNSEALHACKLHACLFSTLQQKRAAPLEGRQVEGARAAQRPDREGAEDEALQQPRQGDGPGRVLRRRSARLWGGGGKGVVRGSPTRPPATPTDPQELQTAACFVTW